MSKYEQEKALFGRDYATGMANQRTRTHDHINAEIKKLETEIEIKQSLIRGLERAKELINTKVSE